MALPPKSHVTKITAFMILLEVLAIILLVLSTVILTSNRYLVLTYETFSSDTSSTKSQLANKGICHANIPDWYELHYLTVCKGRWQPGSEHLKREPSQGCISRGGRNNFSLSALLTADACPGVFVEVSPQPSPGKTPSLPLLTVWDWAVLNTRMPFIGLLIAIGFTGVTTIAYLIAIVGTPDLTTQSPLFALRVWYLSSIVAMNLLQYSSAKITFLILAILAKKEVKQHSVQWSTGRLSDLTWLATGLILVMFSLSAVVILKIPTLSIARSHWEIKEKDVGI